MNTTMELAAREVANAACETIYRKTREITKEMEWHSAIQENLVKRVVQLIAERADA